MSDPNWCITGHLTPAQAQALDMQLEELAFELSVVQPTLSWFEDGDNPRWKVDIFFSGTPNMDMFQEALSRSGLADWDYTAEALEDRDWVSESQKLLTPVRAGKFLVYGSHDSDKIDPALINLQVDAGQAFGTGKHETTAACLALISKMERADLCVDSALPKILDLGTGSGVLALAAHKLWPDALVLATDIDPIAIDVSRDNIGINSGEHRTSGTKTKGIALSVADGFTSDDIQADAPFDLIIANILAGPLIEMSSDLTANVRDGGTIILSGLLITQREDVLAAYASHGARIVDEMHDGDWAALKLSKK